MEFSLLMHHLKIQEAHLAYSLKKLNKKEELTIIRSIRESGINLKLKLKNIMNFKRK